MTSDALTRRAVLAGVIGSVAGMVARALPTRASDGDVLTVGQTTTADSPTVLKMQPFEPGFGPRTALRLSGAGLEVRGDETPIWVLTKRGPAVTGVSESDLEPSGVFIKDNDATATPALLAQSFGGHGVEVQAIRGVGIVVSAATAMRLRPNRNAGSHPEHGVAGDLFVDARKRLWFCKGGTKWKQIA